MRRLWSKFFVLTMVIALGFAAKANAVEISLMLVIDGSGSISSSDFANTLQAYHDAIESLVPTDGSIALGAIQFSDGSLLSLEVGMTTIDSAGARSAFADAVNAITFQNGPWTNISGAIDLAQDELTAFGGDKLIIDVMTDGFYNQGNDPAGGAAVIGSALWAVANGIDQVNTLGIGVPVTWNAGVDSFNMTISDFSEIAAAVETKIGTEVGQVPEPGMTLMLGCAMAGIWYAGRRRRIKK